MDTRNWFLAVLGSIFQISSKEFQEIVWVKGEGPFCCSWEECLSIFDDLNSSALIDSPKLWQEVRLSEIERQRVVQFRDILEAYNDYSDTPYFHNIARNKDIIEDPKWIKVREHAQELRKTLWPLYKNLCEELANDKDEAIRESILFRLWVPSRIVEKLTKDPSSKVAERARSTLENQKLLEEWHKDTDFMNGKD